MRSTKRGQAWESIAESLNTMPSLIVWSLSGMIVTDWTNVPKFVHT